MATFELDRKGVPSDIEGSVESSEEIDRVRVNAANFLLDSLALVTAVPPL